MAVTPKRSGIYIRLPKPPPPSTTREDLNVSIADTSIKELRDLSKQLRFWSPADSNEFRRGLRRSAAIIANDAKKRVPKRSGAARRSIRPVADLGRDRTRSSISGLGSRITPAHVSERPGFIGVKAGGSAAPYFKWLDFGGSVGRGHKLGPWKGAIKREWKGLPSGEGRYMYVALRERRAEVMSELDAALNKATKDLAIHLKGGNSVFAQEINQGPRNMSPFAQES